MDRMTLPPEWAPQAFVLLAWPDPQGDFAPWLKAVEHTYALTVAAISRREEVVIVCKNAAQRARIKEVLNRYPKVAANIAFVETPYRDSWVRDTAPLAVTCGEHACLVDFRFNGWGGKYPWAEDDALGQNLFSLGIFGQVPYRRVEWILEGGSLETDGFGTLLATRSSVQNPNRNPQPALAEAILSEHLGIKRFLWLDHGYLVGDDTDGHIDTLARFCSPSTIVYQSCADPYDSHYEPLKAMEVELARFKSADSKSYHLVPLPLPRPIYDADGQRLPASYANFLILNGAVLVPVYDDPADAEALSRLSRVFAGREIIAIPARALIHQYGSLHCMTMQYPQPIRFGQALCRTT